MKRIIVTTNPYQAQINPIFKGHATTAVLAENLSESEAIDQLKEYALQSFNDNTISFGSPEEFLASQICEQVSAVNGHYTDKAFEEYCNAHKASIEALAKMNGYSVPGLYMDARNIVYAYGDKAFEDDGYNYKIEDMKDNYELLNEATADKRDEIAILVEVDNQNIEVREDEENWYINLNTGLGFGQYPKADFTLEEALDDTNF
ncbi:MAG: hypothetical protein RR382_01865 [Tannerellaceae bacterium]